MEKDLKDASKDQLRFLALMKSDGPVPSQIMSVLAAKKEELVAAIIADEPGHIKHDYMVGAALVALGCKEAVAPEYPCGGHCASDWRGNPLKLFEIDELFLTADIPAEDSCAAASAEGAPAAPSVVVKSRGY